MPYTICITSPYGKPFF